MEIYPSPRNFIVLPKDLLNLARFTVEDQRRLTSDHLRKTRAYLTAVSEVKGEVSAQHLITQCLKHKIGFRRKITQNLFHYVYSHRFSAKYF